MSRAPVFFIGHGSPMNAIDDNEFTRSLSGMRALCPNPKAILVISAHWMTEGSWITHMAKPKTIHDFYGFPQALFDIQYPAPGSPEIAEQIAQAISSPQLHLDDEMWGLDHGAWSVLRHIFPDAKIPTLQLSLHIEKPAAYHFKLGQALNKLRDQNILIIGSGNVVHNLRQIRFEDIAEPFEWAIEFDQWIKKQLESGKYDSLVNDYASTPSGRLSIPTPEHYFPFLYSVGAADSKDKLHFEFEGIHNASISMRTFSFR